MARLTREVLRKGTETDIVVDKDAKGEDVTIRIRALRPEEFFDLLPEQDLDSLDKDMSTKDAITMLRGKNGDPGVINKLLVRACVDPKVSLEAQPEGSEVCHVSEMSRYGMLLFSETMRFSGFGKNGAAAFRAGATADDGGSGGPGVPQPTQ